MTMKKYKIDTHRDQNGKLSICLQVPSSDGFGDFHTQYSIDIRTAKRLEKELENAINIVDSEIETRHMYVPNEKWSHFCKYCGYPEHEELVHLPRK